MRKITKYFRNVVTTFSQGIISFSENKFVTLLGMKLMKIHLKNNNCIKNNSNRIFSERFCKE